MTVRRLRAEMPVAEFIRWIVYRKDKARREEKARRRAAAKRGRR